MSIVYFLSLYSVVIFFFLIIPPPPRSTLFPYTTLFRSIPSSSRRAFRLHAAVCETLSAGENSRHRSEEHTSELQSLRHLVCRLLLEKKKKKKMMTGSTRNKSVQKCKLYSMNNHNVLYLL